MRAVLNSAQMPAAASRAVSAAPFGQAVGTAAPPGRGGARQNARLRAKPPAAKPAGTANAANNPPVPTMKGRTPSASAMSTGQELM